MNDIEKDFVPHQQALELKEIGFNEPCVAFSYTKSEFGFIANKLYLSDSFEDLNRNFDDVQYYYSRPTYSQAFRFFREKYPDLDFGISKIYNGTNDYHYHIDLFWEFFQGSYEEAELECLVKLIEIVKNKQL